MKKLYIYISLAVIALIGVRLGFVAYQHRPVDAYKLQSEVKVDDTDYKIGDTLSWTFTVCKFHDEEFYTQRTLVNEETGADYPIPEKLTKGKLKKGECASVNPSVVIPENTTRPPGIYQLCSQTIVPDENRNIRPFKYCTNQFNLH